MAFSEFDYLWRYQDVAAAVRSGVIASGAAHYETFGRNEGRTGEPVTWFDETYYRNAYADIDAAIRSGALPSGHAHFFSFGITEGRDPSATFAHDLYLVKNTDVANAVSSGALENGYRHYEVFGRFENRTVEGRALHLGTNGADTMSGVHGRVIAGAGNDSITTMSTYNIVFGGLGDDTISAGGQQSWGMDTYYGGAGDDLLINGQVMYGGEGADVFSVGPQPGYVVHSWNTGSGTIMDFEDGKDRIQILGLFDRPTTSLSDLVISTVGSATLINTPYAHVVLVDTPSHLIGADDFLFG